MYEDIVPKKINPRQKANIFSQLLFAWIIPKLYKGAKYGLKEDDLPKCLPEDDSQQLGDKLQRNWLKELHLSKRQPSLRWALWKTFWTSAVIDGSICLFYIMLKSLIPLVLGQLLKELQRNTKYTPITFNGNTTIKASLELESKLQNEPTNWWFWFWHDIYMLAMLLVATTFCGCFINHHVDQRQKRMGAKMRVACCSLIQRKATKLSLKTTATISIGHIVNLISNDVNRLDIGFVFAHYLWILPIQTFLIGYLIWQRLGYASIIGIVALLLQTIPVQMCLSTWTAKLRRLIAERSDQRISQMNELIRGMQVIKMYVWEQCFRSVVKESRRLEIRETRKAAYLRSFYLSSMILPERITLFITIVAAVQMGQLISADAIFAIANLYHVFQLVAGIFCPMAISFAAEAFVSIKRIEEFLLQPEKLVKQRALPLPAMAVEIDNVTASWDNSAETLKNVTLKVPKGKLCIIAGPVGSGKSSLLQLILGELVASQGSLKIIGDNISYASQEPWLFNGSIKNNILFTGPYNPKHYGKVVEKCSLLTDFEQLPHRDDTLVGERGTSLSGGQKARINLARAVYKQTALYLFDDPLSAVDTHVGRQLYEEVIGPRGILSNETRILVTHQTQYITEEADLIVWVENGCVRSGSWQEMCHTIETQPLRNTIENRLKEYTVSLASEVEQNSVAKEEEPLLNGCQKSDKDTSNEKDQLVAEDQGQGCVKASVWWAYFHAGNSICGLIYITFVLLISQAVCSGADYFVNIYTKVVFMDTQNDESALIDENLCLIIYTVLIGAGIFMIIYRCYLFLKTCMHASKVLHDRMFGCILRTTMRFFDTNPSGRILNRFSKDMGAIDESLPRFMSEFTHLALVMLGVLVVICIVNPWLLMAVAAVSLVDFVIIKLYLRSSQDLKRLEGIRRSPVFSHVSVTLNGLVTIRSHKNEAIMIQKFDKLQNIHSAAYHLTLTSNTALGLWLDMANVSILLSSVTFGSIYTSNENYSGNVGLAITQAMMLTGMVQYGLRQLGEAFQQMTSVERILEYTKLKPEKTNYHLKPDDKWPQTGVIQYQNVNVRYHTTGQLVLKNLNFTVASGWKVGIVGRTGAGKSSLIASLFRLCESIEGLIAIDGQDTQNINLEKLRESLAIIPQEPVLFKGTLRYNLDPFEKYQDHELWQVLGDVNLAKDLFLDFQVAEYGGNLSIGQRQLICLARALLGRKRILVMDEATANVDQNTDHLIQQTIQKNFSELTVLTVAHRLQTVMNSDRIMVLDNGELKEFGIPYELLKKQNGYLKHMVEASGDEALYLNEIARKSYNE